MPSLMKRVMTSCQSWRVKRPVLLGPAHSRFDLIPANIAGILDRTGVSVHSSSDRCLREGSCVTMKLLPRNLCNALFSSSPFFMLSR